LFKKPLKKLQYGKGANTPKKKSLLYPGLELFTGPENSKKFSGPWLLKLTGFT